MIGDLGEGRRFDPSSSTHGYYNASYGAADFRAPEQLNRGFDHNDLEASKAAETFSFAVLVCRLLDLFKVHFTAAEPIHQSYPDKIVLVAAPALRSTMEKCLHVDAAQRPPMSWVLTEMEELWSSFQQSYPEEKDSSSDEEKPSELPWPFWDWEEAVAAARSPQGLSQSDAHNSVTSTSETYTSYGEDDF